VLIMHGKSSVTILVFTFLLAAQLLLVAPQGVKAGFLSRASTRSVVGQSRVDVDDIRFGQNVRIIDHSTPYAWQVEPTLAVLSDGRILVGFKEAESHSGPGFRVGFSYSTDNGKTWSPNILMDPTTPGNLQSDPWLVTDADDNAYFVFLDWNAETSGIGVAKTTDGGATWLPTVQASDTTGGFDDKETACIDAEGNLYIVWDFYADAGPTDMRFTKSIDGGATFQATTPILTPYIPYITCLPNGTLFVTTDEWQGLGGTPSQDIWISRSNDGGVTWSPQINVTPYEADEVGIIDVVDTDSQNNIYVAYSAGTWDFTGITLPTANYTEIYVTKSTDGGSTWSSPVMINNVTNGVQRMVEMHIDETDTIHVAWLDGRDGEWNIYYSYSDDGGVSFHPNVRVTSEGTALEYWRPGDYFTLRSGPNGVCIVWTDGRGEDLDIYFAAQDFAAPTVVHQPVTHWWVNTPLTLTVEVTDDDNVESVELAYRITSNGDISRIQFTEVASNTYQATIPAADIIGISLNYSIIVYDSAGRSTRLPMDAAEWFTISLLPISLSMVIVIASAIIAIAVVVVFSVWFLKHTPRSRHIQNS
jgi:hypothetical protein